MTERSDNLSYEDVASAIESLIAEGHKPTRRMIRTKLGRGSMTTISNYSNEYFRSSRYSLQMSTAQLSEQFLGAAIAEFKRIMDSKMKKVAMQLETSLEDVDDVQRELSNALAEIDNYKNQTEILTERIKRLDSEAEVKKTKAEVLLDSEKTRVQALECELNDVRNELTQAKNEIAINTHQICGVADLKARLEAAEGKNADFYNEVQELNRELREALRDKSELEKQLLSVPPPRRRSSSLATSQQKGPL